MEVARRKQNPLLIARRSAAMREVVTGLVAKDTLARCPTCEGCGFFDAERSLRIDTLVIQHGLPVRMSLPRAA